LIEILGCFPNSGDLLLHKSYLVDAINRYHGSLDEIREDMGYEKPNLSSLERNVKLILEKHVDSIEFVDNKRKKLLVYNLNLKNPDTGLYLEIDRFYINERIAIEVQGEQHFRPGGLNGAYTEDRYEKIVELDNLKRKLCIEQNVTLIEIPYNKCKEKDILKKLKKYPALKLKNVE
jgi:hypothetical protein